MKLKILPPTLRRKNRYLSVEIKSENKLTRDDLVIAIWDACIRFKGENETSNFNLWVIRFYELKSDNDYYNYKAIIKCQKGFENQVRVSLILLRKFKNKKIAINNMGISGTIESAISKYI